MAAKDSYFPALVSNMCYSIGLAPASLPLDKFALHASHEVLMEVDHILLIVGEPRGILEHQLRAQCYNTFYVRNLQMFIKS